MTSTVGLIGFGEAAQAFAPGLHASLTAFDRKTDDPALRDATRGDYARLSVRGYDTATDALAGADAALSLVTADQALVAAGGAALPPGLLWFDMNSVAPQTKTRAARLVGDQGGRYVDVAVMAPVHPAHTAVPLLVSGPDAAAGTAFLRALGFSSVESIEGPVGTASSIKMIRSILVKGIEAVSVECILAAEAAGVREAVIASLDASWPGAGDDGAGWARRFDYNLDRMMVHGSRRAAELDEVVRTIDALGTGSTMSRATALRQREVGALGLARPPADLDGKLTTLLPLVLPACERAA